MIETTEQAKIYFENNFLIYKNYYKKGGTIKLDNVLAGKAKKWLWVQEHGSRTIWRMQRKEVLEMLRDLQDIDNR